MATDTKYPFYVSAAIHMLLLILILFFLKQARELLLPLTIAILLSFIMLPFCRKLEKKTRMPRWAATFISLVIVAAIIGGFIYFLSIQLQSFGDDLPELKAKLSERADAIRHSIRDTFEVGENDQTSWMDKKIAQILDSGDRYLIPVFTVTGILITNLILIPLYIFFLLLYRNKVKQFIVLLSHNGTHEHAFFIFSKIARLAQRYLKGILLDALIDAVLLSIGLFLLGIKHAMLFGALVAIINIVIPYMGITLGGLLPFAMAIITKDQFGYALAVMGLCASLQFIDNHFINPYVVGSSVSINPLTALLGLVAAALIWGVYGMLLCIPVLGMLKVVCDNVDVLKPYGFIIGQETEFGKRASGRRLLYKIAPKTQER